MLITRSRVMGVAVGVGLFVGCVRLGAGDAPAAGKGDASAKLPTTRVAVPGAFDTYVELVKVPGGKVKLKGEDGKEQEHEVKGLWVGKFEVRWRDYTPYYQRSDLTDEQRRANDEADSRPSRPYSLPHRESDDGPACGVHIRSAQGFCDWLTKKTGRKFRLPTEAEWEHAARAGGAEPTPRDEKGLGAVAWFAGNTEAAHDVGRRRANAWGLYDTLGNVAEWVTLGNAPGGRGATVDGARAAGGSFADAADGVSPAAREAYKRAWQKDDPQQPKSPWWICNGFHVGFRVVMED
ncbi:MAG: formylglycine-generating enzyme family protein [Phycisphaerae bacterium]|nr:SUMF1/EgtB/PvdO family nonheme iron enzyme [Tepidisphaeraceae bacterium]